MELAVKQAIGTNIFKPTGSGGGGCISSGSSYITDKETVYVKINNKSNANSMFQGEKAGLEAILATKTVRAPKPIVVVSLPKSSSAALVMEHCNMKSLNSALQSLLGEQLARMHLQNQTLLQKSSREANYVGKNDDANEGDMKPVTQFGFSLPTSCGYISQDNTWMDRWDNFYIRQKLQLQVDLLIEKSGNRELVDAWPECLRRIADILGELTDVFPSLLHGDLWSGNIAAVDNQPMIFDPAVFYGHHEYDFGIAKMFGGFSSEFYQSYHNVIPKTKGFSNRQNIYELFHHLNHWNHFGSGYKGSTLSLIKKISKS